MASRGGGNKLQLLNLPEEILDNIVSYLPYDEISRTRLVCQKFNKCCQRLLNQGFLRVERYHSQCLRDIKAQLPRRESERRDHPLARHSDILTAIETRLSLLSMTFMKYVDMGLCCFIPGKVIDEIYLVLRNIQATATPPRSHEILQELRDISSMAMEHFDEHIVPLLKQRIGASRRTTITLSTSSSFSLSSSPRGNNTCIGSTLKQELKKIQSGLKQVTNYNVTMKKELIELKKKYMEQERKMVEVNEIKKRAKEMDKKLSEMKRAQGENNLLRKKVKEFEKKVAEQNQLLLEQGTRLAEQDGKIGEISRKLLEYDRHMASELSRSRNQCLSDDNLPSSSMVKVLNVKKDEKVEPDTPPQVTKIETVTHALIEPKIKEEEEDNDDEKSLVSSTLKCSTSIELIQTRNQSKSNKTIKNSTKRKALVTLPHERDGKRLKQK